jgi:hypothetical protein
MEVFMKAELVSLALPRLSDLIGFALGTLIASFALASTEVVRPNPIPEPSEPYPHTGISYSRNPSKECREGLERLSALNPSASVVLTRDLEKAIVIDKRSGDTVVYSQRGSSTVSNGLNCFHDRDDGFQDGIVKAFDLLRPSPGSIRSPADRFERNQLYRKTRDACANVFPLLNENAGSISSGGTKTSCAPRETLFRGICYKPTEMPVVHHSKRNQAAE